MDMEKRIHSLSVSFPVDAAPVAQILHSLTFEPFPGQPQTVISQPVGLDDVTSADFAAVLGDANVELVKTAQSMSLKAELAASAFDDASNRAMAAEAERDAARAALADLEASLASQSSKLEKAEQRSQAAELELSDAHATLDRIKASHAKTIEEHEAAAQKQQKLLIDAQAAESQLRSENAQLRIAARAGNSATTSEGA